MKQIKNAVYGLMLICCIACEQQTIKTPGNALSKFEAFKRKEKFVKEEGLLYPGIGDPALKPVLTEKINLAADDFKELADKGAATDEEYQDAIKKGLTRFSGLYLDTEDRERVCGYFEELMDIVGLESSGGRLNDFMYGFDPGKSKS